MKEPQWLLYEVVVAIHKMLIAEHGGLEGVREPALLESALSRPKQTIAYGDKTDLPELAASYCYGLARNHPFVDGNKRIALTAAAVFPEINNHTLIAPETEAVLMIEGIASGQVEEESLATWFSENIEKTRD